MDYKIAIIGSPDAVTGFKAVGVTSIPVTTKAEAVEKLLEVYNANEYGIVFVTEDWMDELKKTLEELPPKALPAVVAVPSQSGSTGAGLANLKKIVERAVGSDILQNQ